MYFVGFCFIGDLGFLKCDDICMCVVINQYGILELVLIPFMLIFSIMRFSLLLGLCVYVVMWLSLFCL